MKNKTNFFYVTLIGVVFFSLSVIGSCTKPDSDNEPAPPTPPDTTQLVRPVAEFSYTVDHLIVDFKNESKNAVKYKWNFDEEGYFWPGDEFVHEFWRTGTYNVSLIAINDSSYKDTITHAVAVYRFDDETPNPNFVLENPYKNFNNWYRGQMHTHTNHSPPDDGLNSSEEMVTAYLDKGYDFCALTGHDTAVADPGVSGILFIRGEELSGGLNEKYVHSNSFNITQTIPEGTEISEALLNQNALVQINHPTRNVIKPVDINDLDGLFAIEIANYYNKKPSDIYLWDNQITQGKRIWCNAGDDMHDASDAGHNATMVNSMELSLESILHNLKTGNFYITEGGPDFVDMNITIEGKTITCTTTTGSKIHWYKYDYQKLSTTEGQSSIYTVIGNEIFVRAEVENDKGYFAYSQPIFLKYD